MRLLLAALGTVRALADSSERVPETLQRVRQHRDAVAPSNDAFDVVSIGESSMERAAGESLDALCRRAVALRGRTSGVDILFLLPATQRETALAETSAADSRHGG